MSNTIIIFIFLIYSLLFTGCIPIPTQTTNNTFDTTGTPAAMPVPQKPFTTTNHVYEPHIKTILLYPFLGEGNDAAKLAPPVISLAQTQPLLLEFDVLGQEAENYRAKIFHCTKDWKISSLNDIEFINDFNDFSIRDYDFSINTKKPYTHYQFTIPRVKISGNYLLKVFREGDEDDLLFTHRFIVYENKMSIQPKVKFSSKISEREHNQQIEFTIFYTNYTLQDPGNQLQVVIRQNYRWDNIIHNLKPSRIREYNKELEYSHFNLENNFRGGNEFRRFDLKSTRFLGFKVADIQLTDSVIMAQIQPDKSRNNRPYVKRSDLNGGYKIRHYETGKGVLEADYIDTKFVLEASQPIEEDVYVVGGFNNWQATSESKMNYYPEMKAYISNILLKQGEYNYGYGVQKTGSNLFDMSIFEGTHHETENVYEIMIYYRPFGSRADKVVGYALFNSNDAR